MIVKTKNALLPPNIGEYLSCKDIILSYPLNFNSLSANEKTRIKDSQKATKKFINDFISNLYDLAILSDIDPEGLSSSEYDVFIKTPNSTALTQKSVPAHAPSILLWREISKLTTSSGNITYNYPDPINSTTIYKSETIPNKGTLKFKSVDPGTSPNITLLDVPEDMHQGLVLDFAQLLAYEYVRSILFNDVEYKLGVAPVLEAKLTSNDQGNFMVGQGNAIETKLVSELMTPITPAPNPWTHNKYKQYHPPFSDIARYLVAYLDTVGFKSSKKDKNYGGKTVNDQKEYHKALGVILWPDSRYNSSGQPELGKPKKRDYVELKDDGYRALWKLQNKGEEITNDELLIVAKGMAKARNNVIDFYTRCFYKALGGTQTKTQSISMMTGDGSNSKGLLSEDRAALALFNYDFIKYDFSTNGTDADVYPMVEQTKDLSFTEDLDCTGKVPAIHFNVFARDPFDIFQITVSTDTITSNFKIREFEYGLRTAPGSSSLWIDPASGDLIGRFDQKTNDLKIMKGDLKSFKIKLRSGTAFDVADLNSNVLASQSAGEILLSASAYCAENISIFTNLEGLFLSDRFEVLTTVAQAKIWPDLTILDDFIAKLASTSNISVDLKGGFIGRLVVPFEYDAARQLVTTPANQDQRYKRGTPITYNKKVYVAIVDNAGDPATTPANWVEAKVSNLNANGITTYSFNTTSHVFENNKIYRIRQDQQNTTITSFSATQWDEMATFYNEAVSYDKDARVLFNGQFYQAKEKVEKETFNPTKWKRIPKVESDTQYTISQGPNPTAQAQEQSTGITALNRSIYVSIRYSFVDIETTSSGVKFTIRSFADPIVSNLNNQVAGTVAGSTAALATVAQLDAHTNPNYTISGGRSYNEILTDLRCFGILEALICRIKSRLSNTEFSEVQANVTGKLDALLASGATNSARIITGPQYNTTGVAPNITTTGNQMTLEGNLPTSGSNASDVSPLIGYYEQFKNYGPTGSPTDIANYGSC